MNYKVLGISAVIGVGLIAVSLMQSQPPTRQERVERLASMSPPTSADLPRRTATDAYPAMAVSPPPVDRYAGRLPEPASPTIAGRSLSDSLDIPAADIPVGLPQVAYVLTYGFRLAGPEIPALQQRHADLCESKGPLVCRIVSLNQSTDTDDASAGTLQLAVAASEARAFGKQLTTTAESAEAEQFSAAIAGEDLSKQIVDTEARLRARTLLRDRLMEVLATRRGTVTELVEAERGVAQVNEEIDQARSWLAQMRGRVTFSQIDIEYRSAVAEQEQQSGGFMAPVHSALGSIGTILGSLLAVLIVLGSVGAPVLAILLGGRWLWQRYHPQPALAEAA